MGKNDRRDFMAVILIGMQVRVKLELSEQSFEGAVSILKLLNLVLLFILVLVDGLRICYLV